MEHPVLTVVVVVGDPETRSGLERTLPAILHQGIIEKMEVLVIDCSAPGAPPLVGSDHLSVRTIHLPRETTTVAQARAEGVRQAQAPIVAFMDDHSFPFAGWAEALVKAHEGPWAGVGGEIYNATSARGLSDSMYLMGHGRWMPPARRGEADLLPSHDTSYKREVLLSYGDDLARLLTAEIVFMWKLQQDGHKLFSDPDVRSAHGYIAVPKTLVPFFTWNRCMGHIRAEVFEWPRWKRTRNILLTPIVPLVRVGRLFAYLARFRHASLWTFFLGLPFILLAQYCAALGEATGLAFGAGNAEMLYTQAHLRGLRWRLEKPKNPGT